jgi:DNA-binding PadR family transcriptional regulator
MSHWGTPWVSHHRRGLRTAVLHLLSSGPKSGAEIMDEMEQLTRGWWRPSPGSVYPLLEEMASEGTLIRNADGRYALTDAARARAGGPFGRIGPRNVQEATRELTSLIAFLEDLRASKAQEFESARPGMRAAAQRLDNLLAQAE